MEIIILIIIFAGMSYAVCAIRDPYSSKLVRRKSALKSDIARMEDELIILKEMIRSMALSVNEKSNKIQVMDEEIIKRNQIMELGIEKARDYKLRNIEVELAQYKRSKREEVENSFALLTAEADKRTKALSQEYTSEKNKISVEINRYRNEKLSEVEKDIKRLEMDYESRKISMIEGLEEERAWRIRNIDLEEEKIKEKIDVEAEDRMKRLESEYFERRKLLEAMLEAMLEESKNSRHEKHENELKQIDDEIVMRRNALESEIEQAREKMLQDLEVEKSGREEEIVKELNAWLEKEKHEYQRKLDAQYNGTIGNLKEKLEDKIISELQQFVSFSKEINDSENRQQYVEKFLREIAGNIVSDFGQ
ncbi:MAG: hypothetical protein H7829_11560 [Magnetococcus sp. THC-1_WYH]